MFPHFLVNMLMQSVFNIIARKTFWKNYIFLSEHLLFAIMLNILCYLLFGVVTYHLIENPPKKFRDNAKIILKIFSKNEEGGDNHK